MKLSHKPPVKFLPGKVYILLDESHPPVSCYIGVCVAPEALLVLAGTDLGTIQKPHDYKWTWCHESWRTLEF